MYQNRKNPFLKKTKIKPKSRGDREYRDGRKYEKDKAELHNAVWERALGYCEYELVRKKPHHPSCPGYVSLSDMHLAHIKHGHGFRDDSLDGCFCASAACHTLNDHADAKIPRRPGKPMRIREAREYWENDLCFCSTPEMVKNKSKQSSFCAECKEKLQKQTLFDLEHTDNADDYRLLLAESENQILMYGKGQP